ncbi:MAG: protein kinase [Planctomycetes bacterium]|nr:protein kinase [Planctomycetota bacterium]
MDPVGLPSITAVGRMIGTPTSMSPEQVRGRRVTPAADVWGLGVLLYQALTLELPFQGITVCDLAVEIVTAKPVSPRAIDPYVPRSLESVCLHALARHPEARPPDAGPFASALEAALGSSPCL